MIFGTEAYIKIVEENIMQLMGKLGFGQQWYELL